VCVARKMGVEAWDCDWNLILGNSLSNGMAKLTIRRHPPRTARINNQPLILPRQHRRQRIYARFTDTVRLSWPAILRFEAGVRGVLRLSAEVMIDLGGRGGGPTWYSCIRVSRSERVRVGFRKRAWRGGWYWWREEPVEEMFTMPPVGGRRGMMLWHIYRRLLES